MVYRYRQLNKVAQKGNEMKKRNIIAIIALVVIIVSGIAHDVTTGKSLLEMSGRVVAELVIAGYIAYAAKTENEKVDIK